jgi:hypothetical protein
VTGDRGLVFQQRAADELLTPGYSIPEARSSIAHHYRQRGRESMAIRVGCFALIDPFSTLDHQLDEAWS